MSLVAEYCSAGISWRQFGVGIFLGSVKCLLFVHHQHGLMVKFPLLNRGGGCDIAVRLRLLCPCPW